VPHRKVVGSGFDWVLGLDTFVVLGSLASSATRWTVKGANNTGASVTLFAHAICMTTDPGVVLAKAPGSKVAKKKGVR
jgi:hypothetical protein